MMPLTEQEAPATLYQSGHHPALVAQTLAKTRGNKILVVDDDPDLRLGMQIRLRANYYTTCFAGDARSALSTALAEAPDLIILDIGLPDSDGYAVMQELSAFAELSNVPVIIVTARNRFVHEGRCREAGAKRFFQKPVDDLRLLAAIRQLVG